jgi:hypothetical protein
VLRTTGFPITGVEYEITITSAGWRCIPSEFTGETHSGASEIPKGHFSVNRVMSPARV